MCWTSLLHPQICCSFWVCLLSVEPEIIFSKYFSNRVKVGVKMVITEMGSFIIKLQNCMNLFLKPLQGLLMVISVKLQTANLWKIGFHKLGTKCRHHTVSVNDLALYTCAYRLTHLSHQSHDEGSPVPVCIAEVLCIQDNPHPSPSASPAGTFPVRRVLALIVKLKRTTDWLL